MNVTRFLRITMVASLISITAPAISSPVSGVDNGPGKEGVTTAQPLLQRLHEIKEMDKNNLTRSEKKDLRKEVKNIRKQLKKASNGIYLSVGAIIIIVLILILLLH
jgi:malate/lactate dehydrogenase